MCCWNIAIVKIVCNVVQYMKLNNYSGCFWYFSKINLLKYFSAKISDCSRSNKIFDPGSRFGGEMRWKNIPLLSYIFSWWKQWIAVKYLFSPRSQYPYKQECSRHEFETVTSCMPATAYSTAATVTYNFDISCEFKSD